ncbi:hypothetical protein M0G43_10215 [Subsaxibacter sp. CAU 1640]|uniref:hypothetical protein n=1 Tax=Subsaxibacter sp. CAU 1640 TaxID=2933271 RepID=UPI002003E338|nr:hypothetical protein [Subsaxibacter sp. CAU 1640]MCK7590946.1 hypothetical protein [Subsaxibacter sp. CAU 1640]
MKKLVLIAMAFFGFTALVSAQEIADNAIGLRLGDSDGFGAEVSYQRAVGSNNNRLEFDLGFRNGKNYDGFKLAGLYHWVWNIDGGFNWYVGPGAGLASYSYNYRVGNDRFDDDYTYLFLAGDIGIEYNFDIPLMISLDFRPEFGLGDSDYRDDNLDFDIGIGIRYQF